MKNLLQIRNWLAECSARLTRRSAGFLPGPRFRTTAVIEETVPPHPITIHWGRTHSPIPLLPAGKTFTFELTDSRIFPGTSRTITVYVPAAYHGDKPACVYVGLDGLGFNAATVFDNLIAQHAMPITIGIGVSPGVVASASPPDNPRFDRSFEFDSLNDRLARFLLEEVIPQVEQHHHS